MSKREGIRCNVENNGENEAENLRKKTLNMHKTYKKEKNCCFSIESILGHSVAKISVTINIKIHANIELIASFIG